MDGTKGHYAKLNKPGTWSDSHGEYKTLIQEGVAPKLRKQRDEVISALEAAVVTQQADHRSWGRTVYREARKT